MKIFPAVDSCWSRLILVLALLCVSGSLAAAEEERVSLNFVNADIVEVIKTVSQISKRNFLIDPRVKGTINIVSSTPVPSTIAYDILLSALRLQGFAAVESAGVTKVMPEADAKLYISGTSKSGSGDKLVTRVYMLQHESAAQLVPILRPLIAPNNVVVAYASNNALVITDYASNLKRIEQIVTAIDQPASEEPIVIPVKNASAVDLAQIITRLMTGGQPVVSGGTMDGSQRFVLLADVRSNSLLLSTNSPARVHRVRELVDKLDAKTGAPGNIHVVYLKNSDATKLAQTLRAVMSGEVSVPGSSPIAPPAVGSPPSGGGTIQADAASNALIITASEAVYNNLRAVVEQLDVRRAQVFVEALIVEVTADKAAEFGIQWQGLSAGTETQVGGGTNFGGTGRNIIGVAGSIANGTPNVGPGLNVGLLRGSSLAVLASALETDANANILSTPNLLTLDNEEAKIIIGQNVPFITGSYAQTGSTSTASPFQTIERKDVGLTLRIKPQISQGSIVKMQIYQEVSSVLPLSLSNPAGVITNKRSIESIVLADEGQIVVLGGLVQDSVTEGEDKVPLLGDLPLLGGLFRYETRRHTKTNLMVFIRPYVMRNAEAYQGVTQDRYDYIRGEQKNNQMPSRWILPDMASPELTPLPQSAPAAASAAQPLSAPPEAVKTEAPAAGKTEAPAVTSAEQP